MVYVVIKDYQKREVIKSMYMNVICGCKEALTEDILTAIEKMQEEEDILGLGRPCKLVHEGFGLGIFCICSSGKKSQTEEYDGQFVTKSTNTKPLVIKESDGSLTETGLSLFVEAYCCGFMLGVDKTELFFRSFGKMYVKFALENSAKVFDSPKSLLSYIRRNKKLFAYTVQNKGLSFHVKWASPEFEEIAKGFPRFQKWQDDLKKLNAYLEELNGSKEETFVTRRAEIYAEWEKNGMQGDEPELTDEDRMLEAAKRMKMLNVFSRHIDEFMLSGGLLKMYRRDMLNKNAALQVPLDKDAETAVEKVREKGLYPYAVIREDSVSQITYVLYVGDKVSDWESERPKDSVPMKAAIAIREYPDVVVFDSADIKNDGTAGGLIRARE